MTSSKGQIVRRCPLTSDYQKRATANEQTAAIKDAFPPGIAHPALRALLAAGFTHLDQLTSISTKELRAMHGMGPKAIELLQAALEAKGKSLLP